MRIQDAVLLSALVSAETTLIGAAAKVLIVKMALRDTKPRDRAVILRGLAHLRPFSHPCGLRRRDGECSQQLEEPAGQEVQRQPGQAGEEREPP